jgi:hypothetical protein
MPPGVMEPTEKFYISCNSITLEKMQHSTGWIVHMHLYKMQYRLTDVQHRIRHMDTHLFTHDPSNLKSYHHVVCHISATNFIS